jgi:hypothetical protein
MCGGDQGQKNGARRTSPCHSSRTAILNPFLHGHRTYYSGAPLHYSLNPAERQYPIVYTDLRPRSSILHAVLVLLALVAVSFPSGVVAQIETAGFPVVQLDESARVAALGGSSPAISSTDAGALFSNPALLTAAMDKRVTFSYLNHIGNTSAGWLSYALNVDSLTTAAVGIRYLSFGSIDRADALGAKNGTFNASDISLSVGASRIGPRGLRYGANVSLLLSSIDSFNASAIAADAGVFYRFPSGASTLGLTVQNAGFVMSSLGNRSDRIPFDVRLGYTRRLAHMPLLISVTAYRLNRLDGGPANTTALGNVFYHLILGWEFQFSDNFQIRFGYNHRRHDELKLKSRLDLAGFSTGIGIRISRIGIDYGFNSWSSLGGLHRFTLKTRI